MRPRPALLLALVALAAVSSGCLGGGTLVGKPVPPFELVTHDGRVVNETTHLGRWLVIDLMATWCGPCKLEVAHLREVQRLHGDDVAIISVTVEPGETLADMDAFAKEYGSTWPYGIDSDGSMRTSMRMRIIPKLVIVDPEGIVRFEGEGEVLPAAMTRVIDPSVASPEAASPVLPLLGGLVLGALAAFNPYRRLHRAAPSDPVPRDTLLAAALFALLALAAWRFAAFASGRATYGSLALGALSLGAALWWWRARTKAPPAAPEGPLYAAAGDRAYEASPHFALAVVLALSGGGGALAFAAPLAGFLAGVVGAAFARPRVPEAWHPAAGLAGLALAGIGLLAFGARILLVG